MGLRKSGIKKGIYLIPSLMTTAVLFFGFFSIIKSLEGEFIAASFAIIIAAIIDFFDGKVARLTKADSDFGIEYDSLADLASFGIAPAILVFQWALHPLGRIGWLAAFVYFACAALRLARFNVQLSDIEKTDFQGMPTPVAGSTIAGLIIFHNEIIGLQITSGQIFIVILIYILGVLMVSSIRYRSFKRLGLRDRKSFQSLVVLMLGCILVLAKPEIMFFLGCCVYILDGLVSEVLFHKKFKQARLEAKARAKAIERQG